MKKHPMKYIGIPKRFRLGNIRTLLTVFLLAHAICGFAADSAYEVGPRDVLAIEVYDNPELSGDFTVSGNGAIVFPLLGEVEIAGLETSGIRAKLTRLLEKDYLHDPIVSVTVKEYKSKHVKILGSAANPTIYYLEGKTRLLDLLLKAGVSIESSGIMKGQQARVLRQAGKNDSDENMGTIRIDLYDLIIDGKEDANVLLENGDIIYLPQTSMVHVVGEVRRPGAIPYEDKLTVLMAVAKAGGATGNAYIRETKIKRIKDGEEIRLAAKMADPVRPDDIIEVPVRQDAGKIHVIGEVKKPGSFPFEDGLTVLMAITKAGGATKKASVRNTVVKRIENGKEVRVKVKMADTLRPEDIVEVPLSFW